MGSGKQKPGWTRVAFGEVVRLSRERASDPEAAGFTRYVGLEHIDPGDLTIHRWRDVSEGTTFTNVFRPGQVLFGKRRAYQRKVAVPDFSGVCSSDIYVLESKDDRHLLPDLLPFICQTDAFFEHAVGTSAGSLSPRTNWRSLADYEFVLPSADDQRRIANALNGAEAAINAFRRLSISTDNLRRALLISAFDSLMSDSTVPKVAVGCAGEVLMGRQRAPQHEYGPAMRPYLRVANVFDGYIDVSDVKEMNFSSEEYERYRLNDGDILLNEGQSRDLVGRSALFCGEVTGACFQNTLIRFRPGLQIVAQYAHHFFQYYLYAGVFARIAKQTTSIAHLGLRRFSNLLIPLPTKERQSSISKCISHIEKRQPLVVERMKHLRQSKAILKSTVFPVA